MVVCDGECECECVVNCGLASKPTSQIMYIGQVVAWTRSVHTDHIAFGQFWPFQPAMPAFQTTASRVSMSSRRSNSSAKAFAVESFNRSSFTPSSLMRGSRRRLMPRVFALASRSVLWKCELRRSRVASLFAVSRVEKRRWSVWDWGRVQRNSSMRRQHNAKPRPLWDRGVSHMRVRVRVVSVYVVGVVCSGRGMQWVGVVCSGHGM